MLECIKILLDAGVRVGVRTTAAPPSKLPVDLIKKPSGRCVADVVAVVKRLKRALAAETGGGKDT